MMSSELDILALYGLVVLLTLVLQAVGAFKQLGMGYLLSSRDEGRTVDGIAGRLDRALANSITAMVLFAPAILILQAKAGFSPTTLAAAQVFLIARLVYLPAYAFRITGLRTLVWTVGFAATLALYLSGLSIAPS